MYWAQDLISPSANDLTPATLQKATEEWSATNLDTAASVETIVGDDLLQHNSCLSTSIFGCGMIRTVGCAAPHAPRLIHLRYRPANNSTTEPCIVLIGKGVTYDTGGLNLKPGNSMLNMKKDMGGAAVALGLFRVFVELGFSQPMDCYIPTAETVVSGDSYKPGNVLRGVNGMASFSFFLCIHNVARL